MTIKTYNDLINILDTDEQYKNVTGRHLRNTLWSLYNEDSTPENPFEDINEIRHLLWQPGFGAKALELIEDIFNKYDIKSSWFDSKKQLFSITQETSLIDFFQALSLYEYGDDISVVKKMARDVVDDESGDKINQLRMRGFEKVGDLLKQPEEALAAIVEIIPPRGNGKKVAGKKLFELIAEINPQPSSPEEERKRISFKKGSLTEIISRITPDTSVEKFLDILRDLPGTQKHFVDEAEMESEFKNLKIALQKSDCVDVKDILNLPLGKARTLPVSSRAKTVFEDFVEAISQHYKDTHKKGIYSGR